MKAVVYERCGASDALMMREVERPVPNENEVLVKIHAASLNAADLRSMQMRNIPKRRIFGADIAGVVEAAGCGARKFRPGDEVAGDISDCGFGGLAEYAAVPESALAPKPAGITFEQAAALPMAAVTALQALRKAGGIQPGHRVLVFGAGGGVGTFAVQLAKCFGAEVTAVCGEKNVPVLQSLGADCVIDYARLDCSRISKRFDLILAVNGRQSLVTYRRLLAQKGIHVAVGGPLTQVLHSVLFGGLLSLGSKKMRYLAAKPDASDLEFIYKLVAEGKVTPVIDREYPLDKTDEAMRYLSGGHVQGKIIIKVEE